MHGGVHGPVLQPQVRYTRTTDGMNIAYASAGSGPPLLIFPFPLLTHVSRIWTMPGSLPGPLAESFRVTTYDTRRCGMSDRVAEDFSIGVMLRDVEAVAEAARLAGGGEILVANTVRELCAGKGFVFEPRGDFVAKGFPDAVRVFAARWHD